MSANSKQNQLPTEVVEVDNAYPTALMLCFSRIFPAILNAAVDLNLFEIIAKAESPYGSSFSAFEIASLLPYKHSELVTRLVRMLPMLASYSLLTCSLRTNDDGTREQVYALSPVGEYFAFNNHGGGSLGPALTLFHRGYQYIWDNVKDAIIDPRNNNQFQEVHGLPPFPYMEKDKKLNHIFNEAMAHAGPLEMKQILKIYKGFEGVSTLVDVGGGVGHVLKQVISEYPSIKGINFDLPQVIQNAPPHLEHIEGEMFESVPKGDAILLKRICHNWSDEECVMFLKNCYKALPTCGKVIIIDCIIPEVPNPSIMSKYAYAFDMVMFLVHGGKERTENEFRSLCSSSGFSKFHVACSGISSTLGVMEFYK
ncbi:isoliquiritigenin 2'-O-methyltransferase-like isoform X2 [Lotus japonicus]|uniref:isoliquiritigenin 2'-O-methyltransferase-like isoform X2 n=1 Tax=Lotus japonicus TaxID=34305 RepID=UPI00258F560E|nr:isoliquiritigenin 2'-O-methyltransferase-like isoform X2 [Lotus japonicus]